ncbi:MAG: VOC family protein [Gemmatimonadetes bacterium]|nr:VOC family protein [Gemmatimonadota bacterium]
MLRLTLALSLALASSALGQAPAPATTTPVLAANGAFFALTVPDAEASARWYMQTFGLAVTKRVPRTDASRVQVVILEGGGLIVELLQHDDAVPLASVVPGARTSITAVQGIAKVGVVVTDFDGTVAALRARGVTFAYGPFPRRGREAANVILRDNAGTLIQLFER